MTAIWILLNPGGFVLCDEVKVLHMAGSPISLQPELPLKTDCFSFYTRALSSLFLSRCVCKRDGAGGTRFNQCVVAIACFVLPFHCLPPTPKSIVWCTCYFLPYVRECVFARMCRLPLCASWWKKVLLKIAFKSALIQSVFLVGPDVVVLVLVCTIQW